jgi:hypothetical protein
MSQPFVLNYFWENNSSFQLLYDASPLDSGIYNGDLKHGRPHGQGSIIYFVNDLYRRANYTGVFVFYSNFYCTNCNFKKQNKIAGGWINGTRHGTGRTLWVDGTTYQGQYSYGWEQGIGILRYKLVIFNISRTCYISASLYTSFLGFTWYMRW